MKKYAIPKNIEKEATEYMEFVLADLDDRGIRENADTAALTMLARNYSMFIKASKEIELTGATITNVQGNVVKHPSVSIAKDAQIQALKIMQEFGLTAKARIKVPSKNVKEDESPFSALINKAKELR